MIKCTTVVPLTKRLNCGMNKTGLQPTSRPVELVHYFGGLVEGPSKQTDRTDGGWVQITFGAKAEQINYIINSNLILHSRILWRNA